MKKSLVSFILCIVFIMSSLVTVPISAADEADIVIVQNFDQKVKVQKKVVDAENVIYAVRTSHGNSTTEDMVQYFLKNESPYGNGLDRNPAFDYVSDYDIISKTDGDMFCRTTFAENDERVPIQLDDSKGNIGYIGASHGAPVAVVAKKTNHGLSYDSIGKIYRDTTRQIWGTTKTANWVLIRIVDKDTLIFLSKIVGTNPLTPTFYNNIQADENGDLTLTRVDDKGAEITPHEEIVVDSQTIYQQLTPSYAMTKQLVYAVNEGVKTEVTEADRTYEGDFVQVEEEYTIINPATITAKMIENVGKHTENPSLLDGDAMVTFKLTYMYYSDGTIVHNWENTFESNIYVMQYGGIQWQPRTMEGNDLFIYLPNTKAFTAPAWTAETSKGANTEFNFAVPRNSTLDYPKGAVSDRATYEANTSLNIDGYKDDNYVPNRRLDFAASVNGSNKTLSQAFAGGFLPIDDGANSELIKNTNGSLYLYPTKKAYFRFIDKKYNARHADGLKGKTLKGTGYKKWITDYGKDFSFSSYTVPYYKGENKQLYIYIDIYDKNTSKSFDLSSLNGYSTEVMEQTSNMEYTLNNAGILTATSGDTTTEAAALVLRTTYTKGIEDKIAALPDVYSEDIADDIEAIDTEIKEIGIPESNYKNIEKFSSLRKIMKETVSIAQTLDTDKGVRIQMKEISDDKRAYAVRTAYGNDKNQDLIQYFVKDTSEGANGLAKNPAFDYSMAKDVVEKTNEDAMFITENPIGNDERTPIELERHPGFTRADVKFGWMGAGHGMTGAVSVDTEGNHGLGADSIGQVFKDSSQNKTWTIIRIPDEDTVVMLCKTGGDDIFPVFSYVIEACKEGGDRTLVAADDSGKKIIIKSTESFMQTSEQITQSYSMSKQDVYAVTDGVKTLVSEPDEQYVCDYVQVEEEYTVKNPVTLAADLTARAAEEPFTENPDLGKFGKDLITFKLTYMYYPDGTVIHNWENTFHEDVDVIRYGGIQYPMRGTASNVNIYYPNTKAFDMGGVQYDFSVPASASSLPNGILTEATYKDANFVPNRRLDYCYTDSSKGKLSQVYAGGYLPLDDTKNEERLANTNGAFFAVPGGKAYFHMIDNAFNTRFATNKDKVIKGTAYKK